VKINITNFYQICRKISSKISPTPLFTKEGNTKFFPLWKRGIEGDFTVASPFLKGGKGDLAENGAG